MPVAKEVERNFIDDAIRVAGEGRRAIDACVVPDDPEAAADILADEAAKTIKRASQALDQAQKNGNANDFHDLRKVVKDHWTQIQLLASFWPRPVKSRRNEIAALGELNDVLVMQGLVAREG